MKSTVLFLFLIFTLNSPAMTQENTDSILSLGIVKPLEYSIDNHEKINYLEIKQRDGFYEIEINQGSNSEYIIFKIENIKRTAFYKRFGFIERIGFVNTGNLSNISFEDITGMAFFDDKAVGNIEINESNNTVKLKINMAIHKSEIKIIIGWKNNDVK